MGRLCDLSMVNYTVHIYNEGKTLSVFAAKNAHGTHVSGMLDIYYLFVCVVLSFICAR